MQENCNGITLVFDSNINTDEYAEQTKHNKQVQREIFEEIDNQYKLSTWAEQRQIKSVYKLALEREDSRAITLFGAGSNAAAAVQRLHMCFLTCSRFCDSDPKKQNTELLGLPVISPDELMKKHKDDYIVITSSDYLFTIYDQLRNIGIPEENIYRIL